MRLEKLALLSVLLSGVPGGVVMAGELNVPCDHPHVFEGAAVNVVVLPYVVPRELESDSATGVKLAVLAQQEILSAIAKFGSVGAVQLTSDIDWLDRQCGPENVREMLLGRKKGAVTTVAPGSGLVLLWGAIAMQGEDLYLQSFIQFLRRDADETLTVQINGLHFGVNTSTQSFGFIPRKITKDDILTIREEFAATRTLYESPDTGSRTLGAVPMDSPFPFWIDDTRDGWMHVLFRNRPGEHLREGWLQVHSGKRGRLRARMPELSFVEGVTGYLACRVSLAGSPSSGGQVLGVLPKACEGPSLAAAERAIEAYLEASQQGLMEAEGLHDGTGAFRNQPLAIAVPTQLLGLIALLRSERNPAVLGELNERLEAAAGLVPYSADALNAEVVVKLWLAQDQDQALFDGMQGIRQLQAALGAEPANSVVLSNLKNLYRLMLKPADQQPSGWRVLATPEHDALQKELSIFEQIGR